MTTVSGRAPGTRDPVVAGGVGFRAQPLGGQQLVEPAARVTPHRPPRDPLGALGVARPRRQGAEVGNHIACAHVVSSRRHAACVKCTTRNTRLTRRRPCDPPPPSWKTTARSRRASVARAYAAAAPERCVWGSDWPHPTEKDKPGDALLFNLLIDWVPDEKARNRILVENPAILYGF